MARIPEADLARLKQDVSLQRLVEAKGVTLTRHGADLIGLCPFHNDTSPSLVVTPDKNLWHCLGACQAGGSVIDWVMKAEGVSFRHAIELLRADAPSLAATLSKPRGGRPASDGRPMAKHSTVTKLAPVLAHDADDQAALKQVVDYYHATLKQSPEALAYLEKRA
jgi:DNA primase